MMPSAGLLVDLYLSLHRAGYTWGFMGMDEGNQFEEKRATSKTLNSFLAKQNLFLCSLSLNGSWLGLRHVESLTRTIQKCRLLYKTAEFIMLITLLLNTIRNQTYGLCGSNIRINVM